MSSPHSHGSPNVDHPHDNWDLASVLTDIWNSGGGGGAAAATSSPPSRISTHWPWLPLFEDSPHYTHRSTPTYGASQDELLSLSDGNPSDLPQTMYISSWESPAAASPAAIAEPGARVSSSALGSFLSPANRSYETSQSELMSRSPASSSSEASGDEVKVNIQKAAQSGRDTTYRSLEMEREASEEEYGGGMRQRKHQKQRQNAAAAGEAVVVKVYGKKKLDEKEMKAVSLAWKSLREKEESVTKRVMTRKRRIRRLREDAYWALQVYGLLQGVLYAAVAASNVLKCHHMWAVGILAGSITFSTAFVYLNRMFTAERDLPLAVDGEDYRRKLVAAASNLLRQPIDDVVNSLPENPFTTSAAPSRHFSVLLPVSSYVGLVLLFAFSSVIIVSCSAMLCDNCACSLT